MMRLASLCTGEILSLTHSFSLFTMISRSLICSALSNIKPFPYSSACSSLPFIGGGVSFMKFCISPISSRSLLNSLIEFFSSSSLTFTSNLASNRSFNSLTSSCQSSRLFWLLKCGKCMTWTSLNSPISSYIFFLPSHVVSPITISEFRTNGHLFALAKP